MKTAIYIRVSTVGQNEAGQRLEIERWLAGHNVTDVVWYSDKQTGDNLDRPGFEALQKAIFRGEVHTIVVYKLDRLSRKLKDGIALLCDWCDRGLRVVSVTQQIDFAGTVGKMIASVLFAVAEMEQETRRERQAAGIEAARAAGKYRGRKKGSVTVDAGRVTELKEQGLTIKEIASALGVSRRTVHRHLEKVDA